MDTLQSQINLLWVIVASALVMFMQAGFCCLESGLVRSKNSINVAIKNLFDFCVACMIFWCFGFALMFGESRGGFVGTTGFGFGHSASSDRLVFFLFQMMFCATATTIISGAVAERMRFVSYVAVAVITSGLIYPVIGHWVWADGGWLNQIGFIDFAGSTVVHSTGGWIALAAVILIGPRMGRFTGEGKPFHGHNLPMATAGVIILWFGWLGFNGGSALAMNELVPKILINTCLSAAMGGIAGLALSWRSMGRPDVQSLMYGVVAGLVAITAGCYTVSPWAAVVIGAIGGLICIGAAKVLERMKVDDVIGVISAHACAGVWGTLAVAFFGDSTDWAPGVGRWDQLLIQLYGIVACFVWSFGVGFVSLWLLNRVMPLRVSQEDERLGLNIAEHGAVTESAGLLREMEIHRKTKDFSHHVTVEPFTEFGQVASQYNRVLDEVNIRSHDLVVAMDDAVSAKKELEETVLELQEFNRAAVGRELRMIDLKSDVNKLSQRLELPEPYDMSSLNEHKDPEKTKDQS